MRRREFITLLGGAAAAWPLAAHAQQPAMPVIGFSSPRHRQRVRDFVAAFRQGLSEAGLRRGRNVAIEYRWARRQYDRLPDLAAELVRAAVGVITAGGLAAALPPRRRRTTIPIVFARRGPGQAGSSPASTDRAATSPAKHLPRCSISAQSSWGCCTVVAGTTRCLPGQPNNPQSDLDATTCSAASDRSCSFTSFERQHRTRIDKAFASSHRSELARCSSAPTRSSLPRARTGRRWRPATRCQRSIGLREFTEGWRPGQLRSERYGLLSPAGVYTGRVLKGEKPADLPVQQPTKFELVNQFQDRQGARPRSAATLLARADEVIE